MGCYVYVVSCAGYHKVGVAKNPIARLSNMQTGNPFEVRLIRTFEVHRSAATTIEAQAHVFLKKYAVRGEWFSAPEDVAVAAVLKAISYNPFEALQNIARPDDRKRRVAKGSPPPQCKICATAHWGATHVFPPKRRSA